jgi:hypothetical protein
MEEKNGFLKFQKNRRVQSHDITPYVRVSPFCVAHDREMYVLSHPQFCIFEAGVQFGPKTGLPAGPINRRRCHDFAVHCKRIGVGKKRALASAAATTSTAVQLCTMYSYVQVSHEAEYQIVSEY